MILKDYVSKKGLMQFLSNLRDTFSPVKHQHSVVEITDLKDVAVSKDEMSSLTGRVSGLESDSDRLEEKTTSLETELNAVKTDINTHNTSTVAHNDIRNLISELTTRLHALADSDDETLDQLSEIVAYIKSNKDLIDAITTSKVSVSNIIDNLTTNDSSKVLAASQGVAIKALIDELQSALDNLVANALPIVSPEQFGAVGDGIADDSKAFIDALMTGNKVVCDSSKTYYFANPIDVRTLYQGHLDGNWAHFVNFHLYANLNDELTGAGTAPNKGKFIVENMNFKTPNETTNWSTLPVGWDTPLITTGCSMIIRNIDTMYPYVLATTNTYIDMMTIENWMFMCNPDLYTNVNVNLDAISCLLNDGTYGRCANDDNTTFGDGWTIVGCQEFHINTQPDYYMMRIANKQPLTISNCIQCNFDIGRVSKITFTNCHWETNSRITQSYKWLVEALFINCYFYPQQALLDDASITYQNCYFRKGTNIEIPLSTITNNKYFHELKCNIHNCSYNSNYSRFSNDELRLWKAMPKKTYTYNVINYRKIQDMNLEFDEYSYFEIKGEYTYKMYWRTTSMPNTAIEMRTETVNIANTTDVFAKRFNYAQGGSSFVIVRIDPNGKIEKTESYINPDTDHYISVKFMDYGTYACFRASHHLGGEYPEDYDDIEPWIEIDTEPTFVVNNVLYEANGALVTSDNSVFSNVGKGSMQPAPMDYTNQEFKSVNTKLATLNNKSRVLVRTWNPDDFVTNGARIYSLSEPVVLDGTNIINTDLKPFDAAKDFTIFIRFSCEAQDNNYEEMLLNVEGYHIFSVMDGGGGYWRLRQNGVGARLEDTVDGWWGHTWANTKCILLTFKDGVLFSGKYLKNNSSAVRYIEPVEGMAYAASDAPLTIGGVLNADGSTKDHWIGTIHSCEIYDCVLTDEEITAKLMEV